MTEKIIKVVLGDDHRMLRDALSDMLTLESDIEVVGAASDGEGIIELVRKRAPDVLVLDISMPGISGIEVARRLREMKSPVRVLALSAYAERSFVEAMLKAGAVGYITKGAAPEDLTRAIREVAAGRSFLSREVTVLLAESLVRDARSTTPPVSVLSAREQQVLRLLAEGARSAEIAASLYISPATVDVHRRNIMRKLDLHTVADLTRYAVREDIVHNHN